MLNLNLNKNFVFVVLVITTIVVNYFAPYTSAKGCTIELPNDIPKSNEPLYLQSIASNYKLFKPENATNIFRVNSGLTLLCPGKDNVFINTQQNLTKLICKTGNHWTNDYGQHMNISNLNCTKSTKSELRLTTVKCSRNQGLIYDVGFEINRGNFLSVFQICYNSVTEKTFFTAHQINGKSIKYRIKDSTRISFRADGITGSTSSVNQLYSKKNQLNRFEMYFGPKQQYINGTMFLARGHLTPDADFIFPSQQLATYFYINVAPEYQKINAGNWVRIENLARDLAHAYLADFEIFTGYHEVFQLPHQSGQLIPIYLDAQKKLPVPKWFYKVIKNLETDAAIVIITLNNPFADINEIKEFCPNVCLKASLDVKHFNDISRGYTFCCELDEFQKVVHDLPQNLTSKYLLNCSKANNWN